MSHTRILIVDDDLDSQLPLQQWLEREGYAVDVAGDPTTALKIVREAPPDVVLTDLQMPAMDGIALCGALSELSPLLPVIVVTGFADSALAVRALRAGAEDYLTKPLDLDTLLVSIRLAIERRAEIVEREQLRARSEELYQHAAAAVKAHREVLAIVSHDLRGPLAVIAGRAQQLLETPGLRSEDPEGGDVTSIASSILRSAKRMERLTADLLDESSIRIGRLPLELAPHLLSQLLADVSELRPLAQQKRVVLDVRPPERDRLVHCDRARMGQVLGNLVANAIKFSPAGATVSVSVLDEAGPVQFAVRDEGPGIDPEALPKIFEQFWQSKRGANGVGLGLYIVKGIIESHGGQVRVETRLGRGSTFYVSLPELAAEA